MHVVTDEQLTLEEWRMHGCLGKHGGQIIMTL